MGGEAFFKTDQTAVKRLSERGVYEKDTVHAILDEGFICHVGFQVDGQPFVIPTSYGRVGDVLYIHGSAASRMLRSLKEGIRMCITVTLLDGLVLARALFNHSMNYRSVVVLGTAELVDNADEKLQALQILSEHILPGRWDEGRQPNAKELAQTLVLKVQLDEVSAKVRTGPPQDDDEDMDFPVWAGVIPLTMMPGVPIEDPAMSQKIALPEYAANYKRGT